MSRGTDALPPAPTSVDQLEQVLSAPSDDVVRMFETLDGDLALLGVGGKMGPTMARMARLASDRAGRPRRIFGVSRFRDEPLRERLESWGIETIACDLLDEAAVARLPEAANVISLAGFKFGISTMPEMAWATNCYLTSLVCRRYRSSRIVAFSTGNVYGLVPRESGGSRETDPLRPDGEYAMAAVGRERMIEYFSKHQATSAVLLRLNYATELRYGVLVDLAQKIHADQPVDVTMGYVNVIWLADANTMSLLALPHAATPVRIVNVAGPDLLSTRDLAVRLGQLLQKPVSIVGQEQGDALLSNGQVGYTLWGRPRTSVEQMLRWTADWVSAERPTLGKPTHFQTRTGKF